MNWEQIHVTSVPLGVGFALLCHNVFLQLRINQELSTRRFKPDARTSEPPTAYSL